MTRKKIAAWASATAVGIVLGIGGFALAAFTEDTDATAASQAANMSPLAVVGTPFTDYEDAQTALWPNHPADVVIEVQNPNEVGVTVTSISNTGVVATGSTPSDCAGHIQVNPVTVSGGLPTVVPGASASLRLVSVITLKDTAPNSCQAGTFTTSWRVVGANA